MQLYANGAFVGTIATNIPLPRAYIGVGFVSSSSKFVDYMLGSLDELMLFNRALSASEISALYAAGSSGLVRVPEFTSSKPLAGSQFQMTLRGQTGKNFSIYTSQNLLNWTFLTSLANPTGSLPFTDTTATNVFKFYRASQP
jgi:hypothetical protein